MMATGRGEETENALATVDIKESFAWTVLKDITVRRGTTPSPCAKVSSTDYGGIVNASGIWS